MSEEKQIVIEAARRAIKKYINDRQTWNQEGSYFVVESVFVALLARKPDGLREAIWEAINTASFKKKCERKGFIVLDNETGSAKGYSILNDMYLYQAK